MNCSQAREMLSTYQELKNSQVDTTELDVHLASCDSCRQTLEQYTLVGERIRFLPAIEPASEGHAKLMRTLADEHSRFLQRSFPSTVAPPTPDFLKPYLKARGASKEPRTDALTAFSTADTGPLPVVKPTRKHRSFLPRGHFAVLGLAATVLLVMMTGGLTSLLLLARSEQGPAITPNDSNQVRVERLSPVAAGTYVTAPLYPNVVSAVADREYIYYTAYGEEDAGWMLARLEKSQLDDKVKNSTSLLPQASQHPLIVLGSSKDWLVWLQFDTPQTIKNDKNPERVTVAPTRPWTLYAMSLKIESEANVQAGSGTPTALLQGVFDTRKVASWVHTPIQGIWFLQDTLLVASVNNNGTSRLERYPLGARDITESMQNRVELASTNNGHILTSPTANSDGTSIYWCEEWLAEDKILHGNIWTQQTLDAAPQYGKWAPHSETARYLFSDDEMSFHPQVVNNTLFILSTNTKGTNNTAARIAAAATSSATTNNTSQEAKVSPNGAATPVNSSIIERVDPAIYAPQIDASLQGELLAYSVENSLQLQPRLGVHGLVAAPQAGGRFLLWQNSDQSLGMYDAGTNVPVEVDPKMVTSNASFLMVSGDTAVWLTSIPVAQQNGAADTLVQFQAFNWPPPPPNRPDTKTDSQ